MAKIDTSRDDYILAIYRRSEKGEDTLNKSLANELSVTAASVTEMLKKLVEDKDVYIENKCIYLTISGKEKARQYLTKCRLWELFLVEYLGYTWKDVFDDAKALECVTSDLLKDRLNKFLNKPKHCPHGNEIYENHDDEDERLKRLSDLSAGTRCLVHKVDADRDLLRYLENKNISIKDELLIKELDNFDSSIFVFSNNQLKHIAGKAAVRIMVDVIEN